MFLPKGMVSSKSRTSVMVQEVLIPSLSLPATSQENQQWHWHCCPDQVNVADTKNSESVCYVLENNIAHVTAPPLFIMIRNCTPLNPGHAKSTALSTTAAPEWILRYLLAFELHGIRFCRTGGLSTKEQGFNVR